MEESRTVGQPILAYFPGTKMEAICCSNAQSLLGSVTQHYNRGGHTVSRHCRENFKPNTALQVACLLLQRDCR
jgi:hypothetical protein